MVPSSSKWKVNDRGQHGERGGGGVDEHGVHGDCPYHCQAASYCGGAAVVDDGYGVHGDPGDGVDVDCVGDVRELVTVMDGRTVRRSAVVVVHGYGVVDGHVDVESSRTSHDYYHCCWCCCCCWCCSERTCAGKSDDEMRQQRWA